MPSEPEYFALGVVQAQTYLLGFCLKTTNPIDEARNCVAKTYVIEVAAGKLTAIFWIVITNLFHFLYAPGGHCKALGMPDLARGPPIE